jgi:DeoR family transcriptional regulator of aga operon
VELGASAHHEGEASVNNLLISRAAQVVVVADSSKIGKRAFSRICPIGRIDTLVTDSRLTDALADQLVDVGVKVVRA